MSGLHEAVTRAIADALYGPRAVRTTTQRQVALERDAAAAAIRVVLAEAQRSIEALRAPTYAEVGVAHNVGWQQARREALAVLAALGDEA